MIDLTRRGFLKAFGAVCTVPLLPPFVDGAGGVPLLPPFVDGAGGVPMLSQAVLEIWRDGKFKAVAGLLELGFSRAVPDKSGLPSLIDLGNITLGIGYPGDNAEDLFSIMANRELGKWRISFDHTAFEFEAYATSLTHQADVDDVLKGSLDLTVSGPITIEDLG